MKPIVGELPCVGERNSLRKLAQAQADECRLARSQGATLRSLQEHYGVSRGCIWNIVKGLTYKTSVQSPERKA